MVKEGPPQITSPMPAQNDQIDIRSLLEKYGSIKNVPRSELDTIGYTKVDDTHVVLKSELAKILEAQDQKNTIAKQKQEKRPFDRITFSVLGNKTGRRLSLKDLIYLEEHIDIYEASLHWSTKDVMEEILGDGHPIVSLIDSLRTFDISEEFKAAEAGSYARSCFLEDLFCTGCQHAGTEMVSDELNKIYRGGKIRETYSEPDNYNVLSSDGSMKLFSLLERARGKLADSDYYKTSFYKLMESRMESSEYNIEAITKQHRWNNSFFDISKGIFTLALNNAGIASLGTALGQTNEPKEALRVALAKTPPSQEGIRLREQMRTASIEEKRELSHLLKINKELREKQNQFAAAIAAYYNMPENVARHVDRNIRTMQNLLTRGKDDKQDPQTILTLDGSPDDTRDANPGRISGDCTEGKPLPFSDPKIPAYNIKVLNQINEHIGNIYLLRTVCNDAEKDVWHLDAIQIPLSIDWGAAVGNLFDIIKGAAKRNGVSAITVNKEVSRISNYDYIGTAVLQYCKKIKAETDYIDTPEVDTEKFSAFQYFHEDGVFVIPV